MNYEKQKKELEEKFEKIKGEIEILNKELAGRQQELLRLQGEYRLLEKLELSKDKKNK